MKPQNCLVNDNGCVKLADFGEATFQRSTRLMSRGIGTIIYMSPEMLKLMRYSTPTDIYSLGIMLWEMLTTEEPYSWVGYWDIGPHVCEGGRPVIPDDCSERYAELMRRCWARDPSQRPSASEILTILAAEVRADDEKEDGHEPSRFEVNRELYESLYLTAVK